MQETVHLSKIENSSELPSRIVSHSMSEHIEALIYFSHKVNASNLSLTAVDHVCRVCIQYSSLRTSNLQSFHDDQPPRLVLRNDHFLFFLSNPKNIPGTPLRTYGTYPTYNYHIWACAAIRRFLHLPIARN